MGSTYEIAVNGQNHYRFDKPVTLTFTFDPAQVPAGTTPSIYYYDEDSSKWVDLGGAVSGSTITVTVDHFTMFAVLAGQKVIIQPPAKSSFSDLSSDYWARESIEELVAQGAVSGYPDGTFQPGRTITRAEFVTVLVKSLNLQAPGSGRGLYRH